MWRSAAGRARAHLVQRVGQPRHELGLHKLGLAALELAVLLHGEGGGLQAELVDVVVARLQVAQVGRAAVHHGAGVGDAAALHLQVGEALQLVVRQGARWCLRAARSASAGCKALQQAREEPVFRAGSVRSRLGSRRPNAFTAVGGWDHARWPPARTLRARQRTCRHPAPSWRPSATGPLQRCRTPPAEPTCPRQKTTRHPGRGRSSGSTLACASTSRWRAGGCGDAHLHGRGAAAVANRTGPACRHVEDTILTGVPCTLLQCERIPSHGDTKVQIQPRELSLK